MCWNLCLRCWGGWWWWLISNWKMKSLELSNTWCVPLAHDNHCPVLEKHPWRRKPRYTWNYHYKHFTTIYILCDMLYIVHSWHSLGHIRFYHMWVLINHQYIVSQPIVTGDIFNEAEAIWLSLCWFSNAFYWWKMHEFRLNFHRSFFPNGPINNYPALVQIMARRGPGDKPLSEPMMV